MLDDIQNIVTPVEKVYREKTIHQSSVGSRDMITKIISGGQTGADRAALDVAIEMGFPMVAIVERHPGRGQRKRRNGGLGRREDRL